MNYLPFRDISQYQGNYNMAANIDPIVAIKMGGGDAGLYMDAKASINYDNAVAHGKAVGGYWFAGATDPIREADFFLRCMAPLAENDVYILDWEVYHPDPVSWCQKFVQHIHNAIGVWCIVYMNISTANAHDWSPVLSNCGFWCAAPSFGFDAKLPVKYPVIAQQGPIVNGVDTDAFFGTLEQFKAYGWHKPTPVAPPPSVEPAPLPSAPSEPASTPAPTPVAPEQQGAIEAHPTVAVTEAASGRTQTQTVIVSPESTKSLLNRFIAWILWLFK